MKIICAPDHLDTLKSMLREYQQLDIVIVEKGFDYEGMCYYFSMEHIEDLILYLQSLHQKYVLCYADEKQYKLLPQQIDFIEGYSQEAFVHSEHLQYQIYQKLYELEEKLKPYGFVRINKSTLVNIHKIESIIPEVQRRYILTLKSQKKLLLTRYYVKGFMETLRRDTL